MCWFDGFRSPALGNGCDSVDVPGPNGLLLSFVLVLAPACVYDYDDCDFAVGPVDLSRRRALAIVAFGCGVQKFWAQACACGDGVCDARRLTFLVRGRLSAFPLCFEWVLFVDLRRFRRFLF